MLDLGRLAAWRCAATPPGALEDPRDLAGARLDWLQAEVPGTAAEAMVRAGRSCVEEHDFDDEDWWFAAHLEGLPGPFRLRLEGLATLADVFVDGRLVARSENMFVPLEVPVTLEEGSQLALRFRALAPVLAERRPRPRWKSYLVTHQNLRYVRTSLLGRLHGWAASPAPVGPWRPVTLVDPEAPRDVRLRSSVAGRDGVVEVSLRLPRPPAGRPTVSAQGGEAPLVATEDDEGVLLSGRLVVADAARWWPHTHGPQPLYDVVAHLGSRAVPLGRVGFRTVSVEREDGAFTVVVNGQAVFCRGACWLPPDPVSLRADDAERRRTLTLARRAHMNMVRVTGTSIYEDPGFFALCDELGLLVWQDAMFAFLDPPDDPAFEAAVTAELDAVLPPLAGHPSLTVVCGSQEVEEIAAMNGLSVDRRSTPLLEKVLPALVERHLGQVPYVSSNPTGGDPPFRMDTGVSQYFGVGGYMRDLGDARLAGVRFAAECLALATPPAPEEVEEACGGAEKAGHDPRWKLAVHHDAGRSFDMEDVRDHYVERLFGVDARALRVTDAARALDLGRAANAELVTAVFSEWRRPGSSCQGALVLALRDLRPGAGWGLLGHLGALPKAPWYAARRVFAPTTVLVTDEGLNGLFCHLVHDGPEPFDGTLVVELFARGEVPTDAGRRPVALGPRSTAVIEAGSLLEGFRDLTYAYRFGPPAHDVVGVGLEDTTGRRVAEAVYLPLGHRRAQEADLGLSAVASEAEGGWTLEVATRRFAHFVSIEVPGFVPEDSWFHLLPGARRQLTLEALGDRRVPRGRVRALNCQSTTSIERTGPR